MVLKRVLPGFVAGVFCFYIVAVLFGAPFFSHFQATLTYAAVQSLISVVPLCAAIKSYDELDELVFDSRPFTKYQLLAQKTSVFGLLGAWLGAFFIPLDWDRWWQRWPLPCVFGALIGAFFGVLLGLVRLLRRKRQRKVTAKAV